VFHNTRHTAVTNLVNAGVPAHEAMAVSGHRTRSVFDRYSPSLKAQTRAALERVTAYAEEATAAGVVRRFRRRKNTDTDTLTDTVAKRRRNQAGQSAPSARLPESG